MNAPIVSQLPNSPANARKILHQLEGHRESRQRRRDELVAERQALLEYLAVSGEVTRILDHFSEQIFSDLVNTLEAQLTLALQEVLNQPLALKVKRGLRAGAVTLDFFVERAGQAEDIMKGQGGSVVNVLSVGLRLLAIQAVEEKSHRRFLVLDEQDCWLRPDLVPRLVRMIYQAGKQMGFQVLMISHHDPQPFQQFADRIYRCRPITDENGNSAVEVELLTSA
jgi:hypothetical protein